MQQGDHVIQRCIRTQLPARDGFVETVTKDVLPQRKRRRARIRRGRVRGEAPPEPDDDGSLDARFLIKGEYLSHSGSYLGQPELLGDSGTDAGIRAPSHLGCCGADDLVEAREVVPQRSRCHASFGGDGSGGDAFVAVACGDGEEGVGNHATPLVMIDDAGHAFILVHSGSRRG